MKCNKCNNDIDEHFKFCPNCGNEIIKKEDDFIYLNMKILMLSLPWFGIIYYIVNKDKDYRMKKTFYKLLIFLTLLCLIALVIVSNYNKGSKLEGYEKECYYYCDRAKYQIKDNYCYCKNGKRLELYDDIESEEVKVENNIDSNDMDFSIIKNEEFDSSKWLNDVKSKNVIINVIASSTCPHCHNYNPIIESVASNYKIKLYFIEVDKLENEEYISYINSISIPGYKGYVPYTFITYDGEVVSENVGELDRNETDKLISDVLKQYK